MAGFDNPGYLVAWIASNIVGLLILWMAYQKPNIARMMFILLFGWACWMNYTTVHQQPEVYLEYATTSIQWYSDFIMAWFKEHTILMVTAIAIGQGIIAIGMMMRGWWVRLACLGIIIFLIAIAPLGIGAGFPFSITVSAAAWLIFRDKDPDYIWNIKQKKPGITTA